MKTLFIAPLLGVFLLFCTFPVYGIKDSDISVDAYLKLLKEKPEFLAPLGSVEKGEIEIITNKEQILEVQEIERQRFLRSGYSKDQAYEASRAGIISEDKFWYWVRDAVRFPSNYQGLYNRVFWKSSIGGAPGVCVLPIDDEGKIYLNIHFRHATRSWELELPRGKREATETPEEAVHRELKEETGITLKELSLLGEMAPDTGSLACVMPIYFGKLSEQGQQQAEYTEAIIKVISMNLDELHDALEKGFIDITIGNTDLKVMARDPFLTYALYKARLKNFI